jgi:stage III sporulation protein AG
MKKLNGLVISLKDHKTTIFVAIGILGILLILLSEFFTGGEKPKDRNTAYLSEKEYVLQMEEELKGLLQNIQGAGACDVMVTLENGEEYVYATEQRINTNQSTDSGGAVGTVTDLQRNSEDKYILMQNSDGSEDPLLLKKLQPTIKGVVVLCEGGDKILVQQRITDCVTTALNIASNRICVIQKSR